MIKTWVKKYLKKEGSESFNDIEGWRTYYFDLLLFMGCILLPIALAVTFSTYIEEKRWGTLFFEVGIFIFLAVFFFIRNPLARWSMFFFVLYSTVITFFISLGPFYARPGWLVLCTVTAALLFGVPAALVSVGLNAIILLVLYFFIGPHLQSWASVYTEPVMKWIIFTVNISFVSLVASLPVSLLLRRLSTSFHHEQELGQKLMKESDLLRETNTILSTEIDERKRIEGALRESEKRYRLLAENVRDVIWIFDLNLGYVFVTPSVQQLRGYTVEEALKQTMDQILTEESYQKAKAILDKEFALEFSGQRHGSEWSITSELEMKCKDGSTVWTEATMNVVYNENGEPSGIMGVTRDISPRKQAEEALRNKTEELDRFFDVNLDLLCIADTDGNIRRLNPAWERTLGYTRDELMAKKFFDFIHPEDMERTKEVVALLRAQQEVIDFINRYRCKDETYRWIEWRTVPYGNLIYAAARDITDREQGRKELLESEERFRLAFNTSPDSININRLEDGLYVDINEGFTVLTGFTKEDVIGKTSVEINIWQNPNDRKELIQGLRTKGHYENLEAQFRKKDGSTATALMSARVIMLKGIPHIISVTHDITARIQAEEEKQRLEAQLTQAQKLESIGTLAGGIAHDFNNILSAIMGYTQLAMYDVLEPEKARKELKEVIKASDRAKNLVSQILTFSRKADARYSPISLTKTVLDSIKMMRSVIPTTIDIRHDLIDHGLVMADPTQIHQVMMNLCTNAAHAMDKTGGVMEVRLGRVDLDEGTYPNLNVPRGTYLWLSVSDTGQGMSPEVMERIFDPYFTTKEIGRGTGLGLAVVHGIVQSHGGIITCTSSPGKGTTFDIYLPEILSEEAVASHHEESPLPIGTEHILFVDDEPMLVKLAESMLSKLGYSVVTRSSSSEALEIFQKDPDKFDLIITDMTMPGMTGDRLAQKLIAIRNDIQIILCSGYSEHISEEKVKNIGIKEFVMKPLEIKDLAKIIRKVLDGR